MVVHGLIERHTVCFINKQNVLCCFQYLCREFGYFEAGSFILSHVFFFV
jgi:hypothetical protein